ncbi:AAEL006836-PA [Aedes aegypti]|uniref:Dihydropteridine reductase n=2 Tax=Aedes aegypti TaxID=7159 RepID=Q1HQQ6_AEDAE|nr:dihydropteridine reductase isoform X1 [Aedes aegypti]ABF18421.1 dihydropteridine reductase [Aedes aegypti]EAT41525.1 AAEL006836-PA [Aedes aegypti]
MASGKVLIYGGRGALGASCVQYFKNNNYWVGCIDLAENESADVNIVVDRDADWVSQEQSVLSQVESSLKGDKLDAVICVAGGWAGGNATKDLAKNSDLMWKQSVWSSTISATVGANHLKTGGLLALTGANPALAGTPGMIGYGMAKAAVHQLTKSLSGKDSGLPEQALVVSILPVTLDTPMNRKWMPNADFGTWTPLEFVAELFHKWTKNEERPASGSLVKLITKDSKTELVMAE